MEVTLAEQGIFLLLVRVTQEQARERALEQKFNVSTRDAPAPLSGTAPIWTRWRH